MKILKPQKLQKGDVVGIISPSEPITQNLRKQFDKGVQFLEEEFGLHVKLSEHIFDQHFYSAGTREARISDFNEMWSDPEVKMVLMSQGGETANHLLDGIDYEMISKNPKIFAGISDGTTLLTAIHARTGLVVYHGPDLLFTFGRPISETVKENMRKTLFDGDVGNIKPLESWQHQENKKVEYNGWRTVRSGKASGKLIGGHLGCLSSTMLSGYEPNFDGNILFLEGTDDVAHLDRGLTALKQHGVFEKVSGLVIGWFEWSEIGEPTKERAVRDIVLEVTKDYDFPILEIGELGHNVENYIFPIGCEATIDADKKTFSIDEKTVL